MVCIKSYLPFDFLGQYTITHFKDFLSSGKPLRLSSLVHIAKF